jgi:uncharacterized protein
MSKRPGIRKEFSFKFHITDFLGTQMENIPPGEDVEFSIVLTSVSDGIYLSGTILVDLISKCSRCLEIQKRQLKLQPQAFYLYETVQNEENIDENLYSLTSGHYINLLEILRDSLFEKLEFNPICDPNCTNEFASTTISNEYEDGPFAKLLSLKEKL